MSKKAKRQLIICLILGFVFLGLAIYQWYNFYQLEQGARVGVSLFFIKSIK